MAYNHPKGLCYIVKEKNFCFVPIPKNSSTHFMLNCPWNYEHHNFVWNPHFLNDNNVVCIVREPIERFISGYLEILMREEPKTLEKKFFYIDEEPRRFKEFIKEVTEEFFDAHIEPQTYYLTDENNAPIKLDSIWLQQDTNKNLSELFEKEISGKSTAATPGYVNNGRLELVNPRTLQSIENPAYAHHSSAKQYYMDFLNKNISWKQAVQSLYNTDIILYNSVLK
jgi:hypothetical protein